MVGANHLLWKKGHRFFYRTQKSTRKSSETALIALHGFMGDHRTLSPALSKISNCDAFYVDLPLFGNSELSDEISTFHQYADFLAEKIQEISNNYSQTFLYGYSMGGRIALYLLTKFSDRFSGGILESAHPGIHSKEEKEKRRRLEQQWKDQISENFEQFLSYWGNLEILKPVQPHSEESEKQLASIQENQKPEQLIRSLKITGTGNMPSLWEDLKTLHIPILLMAGEHDTKYVEITRQMQTKLLDAETIIFPGSGHRVHLDQPQKMAEEITQFIEKHTI